MSLFEAVLQIHTICDNGCMNISQGRRSRVFSVSFPEGLARQVDQIARRESRSISELFREAFRLYRLEGIHRRLERVRANSDGELGLGETDVERLVDELRSRVPKRKRK